MSYRYLDLLSGAFVAILLISNVAVLKVFQVGPLVFDGGALIFPISYILGDVMTEVYGYRASRRVIWQGLFWLLAFNLTITVCVHLPPEASWQKSVSQEAFVKVLGISPRIALAGCVAFFWGEICNSYLMAQLKQRHQSRHLALRTISSTLVGQIVDTLIFCTIAFAGILDRAAWTNYVITGYAYKVLVEIALTPVTLGAIHFLQSREASGVEAVEPQPPREILSPERPVSPH